jgi:hypothetical protein
MGQRQLSGGRSCGSTRSRSFRLNLHPYVAGECTQSFDDVAMSYRVRSASSGSHRVWLAR